VVGGFIVTGGILVTALQHWFHVDPKYTLLLGGLGLIIAAIRNPEGIAGTLRQTGLVVKRLARGRRKGPEVELSPPDPPTDVLEARTLAAAGDSV
jgi:branched-chain amino acid transport system permease protein